MFEVQHQQYRSARWWLARQSQIDVSPVYQRKGNLWNLRDQQSLIDSMINGYDIPKLYLADFTTMKSSLNSAGLRYAVIDGKQRLEAIFGFLRNDIPLSDDFLLEDDPSVDLRGLYLKDIGERSPQLAERVEEFPLPVVHVVTDDANRIRELFLRLNKGLVLTGPEKRSAMLGNVPDALSELALHEFFSFAASYPSKRGQDLNTAAKIFTFEITGNITDTKKIVLDNVTREYADDVDRIELAKTKCHQNLDRMSVVFGNKDKLLRSAGSVPAYYWFIRSLEIDRIRHARAFLEVFNRNIQNETSIVMGVTGNFHVNVHDIFRYKDALRSVNDRWSHTLRVSVLSEYFERWFSQWQFEGGTS